MVIKFVSQKYNFDGAGLWEWTGKLEPWTDPGQLGDLKYRRPVSRDGNNYFEGQIKKDRCPSQ